MGVTYRAIQAIAPGKLQTVELPVVEPPTGHVRVRIEAYGNMPIRRVISVVRSHWRTSERP
jgi:hypothetical protein